MTRDDVYSWRAHRERARRREAVAHFHACPGCHEHHACCAPCSLLDDLGAYRGVPLGGYVLCAACVCEGKVSR